MKDQGKKMLLGLSLLPFGVVIHGFVLVKLWEWFVSSTFNITDITIAQAVGLALVIDFILMKIDWAGYSDEADLNTYSSKMIAHLFVSPFVILGMGYVVTLFM